MDIIDPKKDEDALVVKQKKQPKKRVAKEKVPKKPALCEANDKVEIPDQDIVFSSDSGKLNIEGS